MLHEAQGFNQFPFFNSYCQEEKVFLYNVSIIPISDLPRNANVIHIHVVYKIMVNDDKTPKLKAKIDLHWDKDDIKDSLNK